MTLRTASIGVFVSAATFMVVVGTYSYLAHRSPARSLNKQTISSTIGNAIEHDQFPEQIDVSLEGKNHRLQVDYGIDDELQEKTKKLLKQYSPDYAAFVAIDAKTGRILSLTQFKGIKTGDSGNLALRATFPAASVFKIVTAAAAIGSGKATADTIIPFNGSSHTLYRRNVMGHSENRWTRHITLRQAFGKSVNSVFGKLGIFTVGPENLEAYAERFGFNREIKADFPIQRGLALIAPEDQWSIAEAASGYTRDNTMSPLQGAMMAAAIVNDGVMMEPYIVSEIKDTEGETVYEARPKVSTVTMDHSTAQQIRELMRETVESGTSRGSFRTFLRDKKFREIDVGGKTGTLTGTSPKGKCDWFVGYAEADGHHIAVAALTIHEKYWKVKSSYLARKYFENYFNRLAATQL